MLALGRALRLSTKRTLGRSAGFCIPWDAGPDRILWGKSGEKRAKPCCDSETIAGQSREEKLIFYMSSLSLLQ